MVNPDSDLYRQHPDWALNFPGRPRSEQRNQLVLNLARTDVRDYILGFLDKLVTENDIAFLKWDYNRNWSEPGWDQLAPAEQKRVYVEFTRNLYWILAELQKKPGLHCASDVQTPLHVPAVHTDVQVMGGGVVHPGVPFTQTPPGCSVLGLTQAVAAPHAVPPMSAG